MKKRIIFILLTIIALSSIARERQHDIFRVDYRDIGTLLQEGVETDLAHSNDRQKLLNTKQILTDNYELLWTDGRFILSTLYNPESKEIEVGFNRYMEPTPTMEKPHVMKIVGKKVKVKGTPSLFATVEQLGQYTMLVYRNSQGIPVKAYYKITYDDASYGRWTIFIHYLLAGNYMLKNGKNAVFGLRQEFYNGDKYNTDPGLYQFYIDPDDNKIDILYGEGRVSHGDPSSPKYGKMPGGGGAGALMGPMEWQLCLTKEGLDAKVIEDQQFVDHSPRLEDGNNVLTKVQCPWQGIDGKWAFASVIPLTHELLKLFPKDVLELMRAEIYARHGDTFNNAANQQYFNQQPWYKKSGKPVVLTDIERFNVALIKQVMAKMK